MVASPTAFDPIAHPQAAKARRNLVLEDMLQQHYITRQQYDQGINAAAADGQRHPAAHRADGGAVLHQLAAPTDRPCDAEARPRVAGDRPVPGLLRRPEDPHDARPPDAEGRRAGDQRGASDRLRTAERVDGGDRQQDRRGPGDGRRPDRQRPGGLQPLPVQPRDRGPPPAGILVQAVHARDGARSRASTRPTR